MSPGRQTTRSAVRSGNTGGVHGIATDYPLSPVTGGTPSKITLKFRRHPEHDFGPWRGFNHTYRCKRCLLSVPQHLAPFNQPECITEE